MALVSAGCARSVRPLDPAVGVVTDGAQGPDIEPLSDPTHEGLVVVSESVRIDGAMLSATASFGRLDDALLARWPLDGVVGPCAIHHADRLTIAPTSAPSAGDLVVSDTALGVSFTLAVDAMGFYRQSYPTGSPFDTGDTIAIRAAGREVPAFSTETTLPPVIYLGSLSLVPGGPGTIHRAAGLDLSWTTETGAPDARVAVEIIEAPVDPGPGRVIGVACSFVSVDGSAVVTVPAAALATLGTTHATLRVETQALGGVTAAAFAVDVLATRVAFAEDVLVR